MTEAEWLASTNPQQMLEFLQGRVTDRKLRLFAAACCRRGRSILKSQKTLAALEALEEYADDRITREVMEERRTAWIQRFDYPFPIGGSWNAALAYATKVHARVWASEAAEHAARASRVDKEQAVQAGFLREIIGNPFHSMTVDASSLLWKDGTVVKLAQRFYDERAFDRLPILAYALEEAGCQAPDILAHCREPKGHVLGCWVVDLVLGKK